MPGAEHAEGLGPELPLGDLDPDLQPIPEALPVRMHQHDLPGGHTLGGVVDADLIAEDLRCRVRIHRPLTSRTSTGTLLR